MCSLRVYAAGEGDTLPVGVGAALDDQPCEEPSPVCNNVIFLFNLRQAGPLCFVSYCFIPVSAVFSPALGRALSFLRSVALIHSPSGPAASCMSL